MAVLRATSGRSPKSNLRRAATGKTRADLQISSTFSARSSSAHVRPRFDAAIGVFRREPSSAT